jgi:hypothetical protein
MANRDEEAKKRGFDLQAIALEKLLTFSGFQELRRIFLTD